MTYQLCEISQTGLELINMPDNPSQVMRITDRYND